MLKRLVAFLLLICAPALALDFPALTGRVVDDAHILSSGTVASLEQRLSDLEKQTTDQMAVVTLPSLQGETIESYGYQLGRKWGIGQKDKDNGVLLIVAPKEHKVRIEVGYGLEGTMTDAQSSLIIQNVILPAFRSGDMQGGILNGVGAVMATLGVQPTNGAAPNVQQSSGIPGWIFILIFILIFARGFWLPLWFPGFFSYPTRTDGSGFGSGGGFGGFSGGGGSFGGGGASGGW